MAEYVEERILTVMAASIEAAIAMLGDKIRVGNIVRLVSPDRSKPPEEYRVLDAEEGLFTFEPVVPDWTGLSGAGAEIDAAGAGLKAMGMHIHSVAVSEPGTARWREEPTSPHGRTIEIVYRPSGKPVEPTVEDRMRDLLAQVMLDPHLASDESIESAVWREAVTHLLGEP